MIKQNDILLTEDPPMVVEEMDARNPEWEAFVKAHSDCFFCTPSWSRILDAGYKIRTKVYVLKQGNEIVLGIPAAYFDFSWFRLIHAYTPYGEFVGDSRPIPFFLKMLETELPKKGISQIRITQRHYENYTMDKSYRVHEDCQQLIDLKEVTEESLWKGYKKNIRRDVRIAERAGISVRELQSVEEIDGYYAIYRKTMERKRVFGPHPRRLYHEIQEQLNRDQAIFLSAQYNQKLIGGVILIFWKDTVYLLGNASDPDYHSLCPNDFLIHESFLLALRRGYRFFDFMTTGESFRKLNKLGAFKEKWGAVRYPFMVYEKDLNFWRAGLWNQLWKFVNTPVGSAALRLFINR